MSRETPPAPPPAPPDRSLSYAIAISVVLLALAVLGGSSLSRLTRPAPSPPGVPPSPITPASATPPPTDTSAFVFTQPLSAGCAAGDAVYVVSNGGGIGRYAFDGWQLIDPTARSLVAAACQGDVLTAVGGGGRVVAINDRDQTIRSDSVLPEDFLGLAPLADGVLVVGRAGTVERQGGAGWGRYASGIEEDLFGVAAFDPTSAWAVGAGGASYRLEPGGWRPVPTGVTSTLRAIAATSLDDAVAAGDDGVVLVWAGRWERLENIPKVRYQAVLRAGAATYAAGDGGTLISFQSASFTRSAVARIDLGTSCTLRALFGRGDEIWVIGSDGGRSAVWRITGGTVFRWGQCP